MRTTLYGPQRGTVIALVLMAVLTVILAVLVPAYLFLKGLESLPFRPSYAAPAATPVLRSPLAEEAERVYEEARRDGELGRPEAGLARIDAFAPDPSALPDDLRWGWFVAKAGLYHAVSTSAKDRQLSAKARADRDQMLARALALFADREDKTSQGLCDFVRVLQALYRHEDSPDPDELKVPAR